MISRYACLEREDNNDRVSSNQDDNEQSLTLYSECKYKLQSILSEETANNETINKKILQFSQG